MDKFLLDITTVDAFQELYPSEASELCDDLHISYGGVYGGKPAALISYRMTDQELYLDWIYTAEPFRRKGLMSELLDYTLEKFESIVSGEYVNVICPGTELMEFLDRHSFEFETETVGTSYIAEVDKMKMVNKKGSTKGSARLSEVMDTEIKLINNELINAGPAAYCVKRPLNPADYFELSRVSIVNNRLCALILLNRDKEDTLDISYVYKADGAEVLLMLNILEISDELKKEFPECKKIRTTALNDASRTLFEALFEESEKEPVYSGTKFLYL